MAEVRRRVLRLTLYACCSSCICPPQIAVCTSVWEQPGRDCVLPVVAVPCGGARCDGKPTCRLHWWQFPAHGFDALQGKLGSWVCVVHMLSLAAWHYFQSRTHAAEQRSPASLSVAYWLLSCVDGSSMPPLAPMLTAWRLCLLVCLVASVVALVIACVIACVIASAPPYCAPQVMIQPQLTAYHFNGPPEPVLLDVQSILPERILLLDAYFYIVIFHGQTIATWRKAGYHTQAEHAAFAQLLQAPQDEAKEIMVRRFPAPRLVDCDYQGSQVSGVCVREWWGVGSLLELRDEWAGCRTGHGAVGAVAWEDTLLQRAQHS